MPKKLGVNSKAVEANSRKEAAKRQETERLEKMKEDEYWRDDDKLVNRKLNRKEEKEKKKTETMEKKAALKAAYDTEMQSDHPPSKGVVVPSKVTRAQITAQIEKPREKSERVVMYDEIPIEENINRISLEGELATTVEEAINVLTSQNAKEDRHPERRMKAAYAAFEEENLPRLKAENPNLRLSQLNQMLRKDWMKSPSNPLNQRLMN